MEGSFQDETKSKLNERQVRLRDQMLNLLIYEDMQGTLWVRSK